MIRLTVAYLTVILAAGSAAADDINGTIIAQRVREITATTKWDLVHEIPLQFEVFHPQGMAIVEGEIFVSTVEVIDRAKGSGKGHVYKIAPDGTAAAHVELTDGLRYHPGGMDFDGMNLIVPVAEYRPDSSSVVYAVSSKTLQVTELFRVEDHIGGIVRNGDTGIYAGMSWGSRRFYQWTPSGAAMEPDRNRAHYVDFQDAQWLPGTGFMLCGGLKNYNGPTGNFSLGGIELIEMRSLVPEHQVPVPLWEPGGRSMLQNAFHVELFDATLRFWFLPGDGKATIYIYEPRLDKK